MLMHVVVKYAPYSLWCTDISSVDMLFDLVTFVLHCSSVWSLVYVLKAILNSAERCDTLNVDMAVVLRRYERVVGDNPTIVEFDNSNA